MGMEITYYLFSTSPPPVVCLFLLKRRGRRVVAGFSRFGVKHTDKHTHTQTHTLTHTHTRSLFFCSHLLLEHIHPDCQPLRADHRRPADESAVSPPACHTCKQLDSLDWRPGGRPFPRTYPPGHRSSASRNSCDGTRPSPCQQTSRPGPGKLRPVSLLQSSGQQPLRIPPPSALPHRAQKDRELATPIKILSRPERKTRQSKRAS